MGIIKKFIFDNVDSSNYGVGITGEAVYNAPTRDVEMITIPGRNGDYTLDHGRFNNIEITYPAGAFDTTQTNFASKVSDLRNALASKVGYKRLEDEYNPDEYRMATYKSGLEVSPVHYSEAGEFDIVFDCKPQRFLKSGETAVSVANNGSIVNPTLFPAQPLLEVVGYGNIELNQDTMSIYQADLGRISIDRTVTAGNNYRYATFDTGNINAGDDVYLYNVIYTIILRANNGYTTWDRTAKSGDAVVWGTKDSSTQLTIRMKYDPFNFKYGTSKTSTTTATYYIKSEGTNYYFDISITASYNGSNKVSITGSVTKTTQTYLDGQWGANPENPGRMEAYSTKPAVDNTPIYIDLDIGEAYKVNNGTMVSVDNLVSIPAELPTLKAGTNNITYDNTITSFKITPRWWKV